MQSNPEKLLDIFATKGSKKAISEVVDVLASQFNYKH